MIKLFNYAATSMAIQKMEDYFGGKYTEITMKEVEKFLQWNDYGFKTDSEKEFLWHEKDEVNICYLDFGDPCTTSGCRNYFKKVEELGIYIAEDNGENYYYGKIGDTSQFMGIFLTYYTGDLTLIMESIYEIELKEDVDQACYNAVQDFISKHKDEDGKSLIEFHGDKITSLHKEIAEFTNDYSIESFFLGYYLGKEIYEINNKLYYLRDDSYVYNTQYHWYLQEVGEKCYKYFEYIN